MPTTPIRSHRHKSITQPFLLDLFTQTGSSYTLENVSRLFPIHSSLPPLPDSPSPSPNILSLPPLPDSPTPPGRSDQSLIKLLTMSIKQKRSLDPLKTSPTSLSPKSIDTISDLTSGFLNLKLNTETSVPCIALENLSQTNTTETKPNIKPLTCIAQYTMASPQILTPDQYALHEIDQATKNLNNYIKFSPLEKDGSNFIEWKKNTSRAMKAML